MSSVRFLRPPQQQTSTATCVWGEIILSPRARCWLPAREQSGPSTRGRALSPHVPRAWMGQILAVPQGPGIALSVMVEERRVQDVALAILI